jgi:hypothetical protein
MGKAPDFTCIWDARRTAVEAKNLRNLRCVEHVMLDLFNDAQMKDPQRYSLQLVMHRSDRRWLAANQERELADLVRNIPDACRAEGHYREKLPSGPEVVFEIRSGNGCMAQDAITVKDLEGDYSLRDGLCTKAARVVGDAIEQLYSGTMDNIDRRVVVIRWEIPWFGIPYPTDLERDLQSALNSKFAELGRRAEVVIHSELGVLFTFP